MSLVNALHLEEVRKEFQKEQNCTVASTDFYFEQMNEMLNTLIDNGTVRFDNDQKRKLLLKLTIPNT